jgi:hypothetical protein
MPAPVAGIHDFSGFKQDVDGRDKHGHDVPSSLSRHTSTLAVSAFS